MLYIALPAILDTNPFQDTDEDSDKKPQEVETVISIFQTTYEVVKAYSVHVDIIHQLFAYLFFFLFPDSGLYLLNGFDLDLF